MIRDPDASVTLRHGDPLTLTCTIQLDPAVDSDVVVTGNLQGQAGRNSTIVTSSDGVYKIILYIHSLRATSSDTYTCSATVTPDLGVMYVQRSELNSDSLDITVGKYLHVQCSCSILATSLTSGESTKPIRLSTSSNSHGLNSDYAERTLSLLDN